MKQVFVLTKMTSGKKYTVNDYTFAKKSFGREDFL